MKRTRIDPGELRTPLTLQAPTATPDGAGGHGLEWNAVATVFARLEPVAASSRWGGSQAAETVTHLITLRMRADVESGMRLVADGRIFTIVTAHDPDESGRYLVCRTTEEGR